MYDVGKSRMCLKLFASSKGIWKSYAHHEIWGFKKVHHTCYAKTKQIA